MILLNVYRKLDFGNYNITDFLVLICFIFATLLIIRILWKRIKQWMNWI
jgi:hypothetical protein